MKTTKILEKTLSILLGVLIISTPVLANPIDNMIVGLRNWGFGLVLLWLLTLAVVYGILTHLNLPNSMATRGVISIVVSFLVLIAAAGSNVAIFMSNLTSYAMVVGFGIIITLILLELAGAKIGGVHIFGAYPRFFAIAIVLIAIMLFLVAGGLNALSISVIVTSPITGVCIFLFVIVVVVWMLTKDEK